MHKNNVKLDWVEVGCIALLELIPCVDFVLIFTTQIFIFQIGVCRMGALWWLEEGRGASTHPRGEKEKEEEEEHPSEEEKEEE